MRSIRQRLALGLISGLAALVILVGAVVLPALHRLLVAEFDYALLAKARALTTLADPARRGVNLQFTEASLPEFQPGAGAEYFQAALGNGTVLARSPSLGAASFTTPAVVTTGPLFWNVTLPGAQAGRAVALRFADDGANDVLVIFARNRDRLDRTWLTVLLCAGGGALGLLALMWFVVRRAVGVGLQPVHALAREVTGISSTSLEKRVSTASIPEELRPITTELNCVLEHLQSAFERERRFTSDAAHELSTPIAELRALTDVALRWRDDPEVTVDLAGKANAIAQQMERIVRVLLALARAENCRAQMQSGPVDVALMTRELAETLRARFAAKNISIRGTADSPAVTETDPTLARALLFNILDNAVEHAPPGGAMEYSVHRDGPLVRVVVSNTQRALGPEDLPHIFEPLWRKDPARTDGTHCGVGLALVKAYAEALGATVGAELARPDLFRVTIAFAGPRGRNETSSP